MRDPALYVVGFDGQEWRHACLRVGGRVFVRCLRRLVAHLHLHQVLARVLKYLFKARGHVGRQGGVPKLV
jgi:hypothetical protein